MAQARDMANQITEQAKNVGGQALERADQMANAPMRVGEQTPSKVYMGAVVGSILASAALFLAGRTAAGIFVGLWAPTILNLGLFNKLLQPSQESMTGAMGSSWGSQGGLSEQGGYGSGSSGFGTSGTTGGTETGRSF
jgi:hypothetical protein